MRRSYSYRTGPAASPWLPRYLACLRVRVDVVPFFLGVVIVHKLLVVVGELFIVVEELLVIVRDYVKLW
jgi:hypothetical protein